MSDEMVLHFNEEDLTVGDLEDFEDAVGVSFYEAIKEKVVMDDETGKAKRDEKGRIEKTAVVSAKALKGLIYIVKRKEDPKFTLEQARNQKVSKIVWAGGEDQTPSEATASPTE